MSNNTGTNSKASRNDQGWWGPFVLGAFVLLLVSVLLIGFPMWIAAEVARTGGDIANVLVPMVAVLIGLTTMTISGIFLFMTLRIDRGARLEARSAAKDELKDLRNDMEQKIRNDIEAKLKTVAKKLVKEHIPEDFVRKHAHTVLQESTNRKLVKQTVETTVEKMSDQDIEEMATLVTQTLKNRQRTDANWFSKLFSTG